MGNWFKKLFSPLRREYRILMLGLDNAGKTTILYQCSFNENFATIPTVGFNVETIHFEKIRLSTWDIGGQDKIRMLWKHYFFEVDALIFVVDSNDYGRFEEARIELHKVLKDDHMKHVPVLLYLNKQDLPKARTQEILKNDLEVGKITNDVEMQTCVATTGEGLEDGLKWLCGKLKEKK